VPRPPAFKTTSLADLHRQLRYAPPETRERQMLAAETLAGEIEPGRAYPEEFIVFRITQYRPGSREESVMLVGAAVLADLATLVQSLSTALDLQAESPERGHATPVEELAERLRITPRTLRRYHKRGLLLHYVTFEGGERRLACYEGSLERFQAREPDLVDRARQYTRLSEADERMVIDEAIRLHREGGLSRQEIARELAKKHNRGVETMRALLAREEEQRGARLFKGTRRLSRRDELLVVRGAGRGVHASELARHLKRSVVTIRRCINAHRAARLRDLPLSWIDLPTFTLADAESIILAAADVQAGLGPPPSNRDGIELVEHLRRAPRELSEGEESRLAAYNLLKRRVASGAAELDAMPADADLDALERDLRWAALLKRAIVFDTLPAGIVRVEQNLARPLHQQTTDAIRRFIHIAVEETSQAAELADPSRDQRVDRIASLAIDKALAREKDARGSSAAGVRHAAGSVPLGDPLAGLCAWQPWVELPLRFATLIDRIDQVQREIMSDLHGLDGARPLEPREIAVKRGMSLRAVQKRLSLGLRALRRLRASSSAG